MNAYQKGTEIMNNMVKEFKEFIMRGNVIDLAVAVIIGEQAGVARLRWRVSV